jgi:hypothetical protein
MGASVQRRAIHIFQDDRYLLGAGQISYEAFVQNPKLLKNVTRKDILSDDMNGDLFVTWVSETGRCTSFAIKVVDLIEKKYPGQFEFDLYDLNGHRIARCHKTGILIDSSSRHGAFELKEGKQKSFEGSDAKWKWISGTSKFETSRSLVRDKRSI